MITITIQPFEVFDERSNKFIKIDKKVTLKMENSLHAISEWEKKFKKRYFPERNNNPYKKPKNITITNVALTFSNVVIVYSTVSDEPGIV